MCALGWKSCNPTDDGLTAQSLTTKKFNLCFIAIAVPDVVPFN